MKWTRRFLCVVPAVMAIGCSMVTPPPSIEPKMPRRGVTPRSYKMKLAVFNLQDPTGSGGRLSESVSETLHEALFQTGRFELMTRAELSGIDPGDIRRIQDLYRRVLDALVVGSLTQFNPTDKTMTLNINVMNPYGLTMAARAFTVKYYGTVNVNADAEDIGRIAEWIERKFPKLKDGLILSRSDERVTINLGSNDGVQPGMWVLIAAGGDVVKDPQTGEFLGSDIYVGEAYVVGVDDAKCQALLVRDENKQLPPARVKDKVIFK
jgi:hypothetical protein